MHPKGKEVNLSLSADDMILYREIPNNPQSYNNYIVLYSNYTNYNKFRKVAQQTKLVMFLNISNDQAENNSTYNSIQKNQVPDNKFPQRGERFLH